MFDIEIHSNDSIFAVLLTLHSMVHEIALLPASVLRASQQFMIDFVCMMYDASSTVHY